MNKIFLIGRLTKEPELRHTTSGIPVCQINLAVNRPKQKDKQQEADFINVIIWDKQGKNVAKYQTKGNLIAVEGKLQTSKYEDKDKKVRYKTDVIATSIQFLDSKKEAKKEQENSKEMYEQFGNKTEYTAEELDMDLPF